MGKQSGIRDADKTIQVLFEISSAINNVSTLDELYRSIHKSLGKILNVDNIYIALYHEEKDSITFPYYVDEKDENFIEVFEITKKQTLTAKVINQKKALLATYDDFKRMAQKGSGELVGTLPEIWIGAPLKIRGRAFGALALQSYTSTDMYKQSDLAILSSVSDFIAISIERKHAETAQKASKDALKKSETINKVLFTVSNAVNTTQDLAELYKSIHNSLGKVIDLTNFIIGLYNKKDDVVSWEYYIDQFDNLQGKSMSLLKGSIGRDVIRSGKPLFLSNEKIDERMVANKAIGTSPKIWMGVPLKVDNEVIGYMATQSYNDPNLFDEGDLDVFSAISDQVATAIERKRAEDAETRSREINQVMFAISNAANTTSSLDELYKSIHKTLGKIIDVTNFIIGVYDHKKDIISYPYYVDEIGDVYKEIHNVRKSGIVASEVINRAEPFFITKDEIIERARKKDSNVVGIAAEQWLGIPLKIKKEVIGVIVVQSYSDPELYSQNDVEILLAVSDQVAMAIDRKREEEARTRSEGLNKTMFEISNSVNTTMNLKQLCKSIHISLQQVIYAQNFSLCLYDKEIDQLNFPYRSDKVDFTGPIKNVSQSSSIAFEVIRRGKTLLLDAQGQKKLVKELGGDVIGVFAKSWLCVPLKVQGEAIGAVLIQDFTLEHSFSNDDTELLGLVSDQIALSIEHKRAEDAEKKSKEINRVMFAISNAVNTTESLDELYKSIHEILGGIIDVVNFMIGIYDFKKDSISYPYFVDETDDDFEEIHNVSKSGLLASEVINSAKPFLVTKGEVIARTNKRGDVGLGAIPEQWLGIPLVIKKQVVGVMVVQSYSNPELYNMDDVEILLSVSDQIAMAIERKQSEENIKKNEKLTGTLFNITSAVSITDNLDELYVSIYDSLNALIELPNFFIVIVDEEKKSMYFPFYKDEYDSEETVSFTVDDYEETGSITTDVIKSKKAMFFKEEELKKNAAQKKLVGALPVIWLGVPLIIRDKVIGVMTVQHYSDPEYFTEKDMDLFIAVSVQIAIAIDRKRFQDIILEREKQILQLSRQSQEFSLVAASIISMKEEKEIFRYISKAIVKHSDYNRIMIAYFIDKPPYREIIQYEGVAKKEIDRVRNINAPREYYEDIFKASIKVGSLSYYVPHTNNAVLGSDIPLFMPPQESDSSSDGWHREDMIFLKMNDSDGKFVGVISVDDSKSRKKPTNETVRPLEIFSSLISQIMIFRKIQNELKDHKDNLEKMVDERTKELTTEIVERIQIEEKLKKAKAAAEAAARIKGEFLTNMSHEIRTPINGIMGMAEIAMGNDLDDDLRKIIQTIDSEAGSLLDIINQILDFSKIEAGKLTLEKIPFDLKNTFEKACSLFSMGMKNKGIEFIPFLAPDVPLKLIGDPGRLRQVLLNLAGNAIKFTHKGEIFIKVEKVRDYKNKVEIRFIVKDTGIGIDKAKQKTIFDSFSQADGSTTRKYGGTGLGTTISKQLVELMGGEIGLESKTGKGSTFWFTVKFEQQKGKIQEKTEVNIDLNGLKVLVADDNKTNRFVLIEYLKSFGIEPVVAENGKDGLKLIKQSYVDKKPFDTVMINLMHSNIDGFEFAANIRQNKDLIKLPIIMLASSGRIGDGQACKDIGIDAYLLKPVTQYELKRALATVLYNLNFERSENKRLITRHTIAEESINSSHVLVVEDYATNQLIATKHLKKAGYQVTLAENGKIAVDLFKKKQFDVIMMDIQMPVIDGHQATKLIREYESKISDLRIGESVNNGVKKNRVPIIAMTAHAIVGYREKCIKSGMDDYISKPLRREKFLAMVDKWASNIKTIPVEKGSKKIANIEEGNITEEMSPDKAPIDLIMALEEFEDDKEFLLEVIDEFFLSVDKQLLIIKNAISDNDAETLRKESHSIKGGSANLTANNLSKFAHDLENIGKSKNLENSSKMYQCLEEEFSRLKDFMAKADF